MWISEQRVRIFAEKSLEAQGLLNLCAQGRVGVSLAQSEGGNTRTDNNTAYSVTEGAGEETGETLHATARMASTEKFSYSHENAGR
jgi:hypothetical protein